MHYLVSFSQPVSKIFQPYHLLKRAEKDQTTKTQQIFHPNNASVTNASAMRSDIQNFVVVVVVFFEHIFSIACFSENVDEWNVGAVNKEIIFSPINTTREGIHEKISVHYKRIF